MDRNIHLLYVEDDVTLSYVTRDNLALRGYRIDHCGDGMSALEKLGKETYDLCILDVMLPKMDGFTLAAKIRETNREIPIIFLTARTTKEDRIQGLKIGADDYLTKPFSIEELVLKIEVFLKRSRIQGGNAQRQAAIRLGVFDFDPANQSLSRGGELCPLTHRESVLLALFVENRNSILQRDEILINVWGNDHFFASRSLDVFISRLRKILRADPGIRIENIHNVGYRLRTEG